MLVVAAVSAGRLVLARSWQRGAAAADIDVAHLLMALAMAGTLAPVLAVVPSVAWRVIFAMMTAWFAERVVFDARARGIRALAGGHCAPHLVHSAAMLYMFLALVPPASGDGAQMAGMGGYGSGLPGLRYPTLAFVFALVLIGYAVWDLDQLSSRRHGSAVTIARVPGAGVGGARVGEAALAGMSAMPGAEAAAFSGSSAPPASAPPASAPPASAPAAAAPAAAAPPADADTATDPPSRPAAAADVVVRSGLREILLSPGVTVGCRIVMGVTMAFMLLIMI